MKAQWMALLLVVFSFSAHGAKQKKYPQVEMPPAPVANEKMVFNTKAVNSMISSWAKKERKPASSGAFDESDLSPSYKHIRDQILSAKTADDFEARLTALEAGYDGMTEDAKFFAAQMIMLKPLRGVVWRLRPLFETGGGFLSFSGNKGTHSAAVSALRFVSHAINVYLPTDQSEALFDYLTVPSKNMKSSQQFTGVSQFQQYLRTEVYPSIEGTVMRLSAFESSKARPYIWDNKVLFGTGAFEDGIKRYVGFHDAEYLATMGALHKSLNNLLLTCAYNQDALMDVMGAMGKLYGVDGFRSADLGVTSKEKAETLNSFRNTNFLTLKTTKKDPDFGKKYFKAAYVHLKLSAEYMKATYQVVKDQPASTANVINPLFFNEKGNPELGAGVLSLSQAVNEQTTVRSGITGETLVVDIPSFYSNPPQNLLALLPNSWESSAKRETTFKNASGENLTYRNYREGRPKTWNKAQWQALFPSMGKEQNVDDAFRVLGYSHGPSMILGSLAYFVY